jgi:FAD/FMN-containing dehydrogenase
VAAVSALQGALGGELVRPHDAEYDSARRVFNATIDRRPALIVRCTSADDVVEGVNFARDYGLPISVRGGGHGVAGNAVCEGGLMLDLSRMKAARVDPLERVARAEPGLTLGDLDSATQHLGLATPLGIVSVTGIAGLTLGGGLGWLNGKYGLACDNLLGAEVVTADGRRVFASPTENDDLYWAIRGGGGNFGVVTDFVYDLHPVGPVLAGTLSYAPAKAREALRFFDAAASDPTLCPDELTLAASLGTGPDRRPVVSITACYCGPIETGERVLRPLRLFSQPESDTIQPMAYIDLQRASDAGFPAGRHQYWKSSYLRTADDSAIDVMLHFLIDNPTPALSGVGLQQMHGAASRVEPRATAFAHRARQCDFLILSQASDTAEAERNRTWARAFFEAMQPYVQRAVYANNLGEEGAERVRAAYGVNYARLAQIKRKYDPTNLFRYNHNIEPA